jgi:hypothetical protein
MEQYFSVSRIDVGEQVDSMNDTHKHLKKELKEQFMVNKTSWIA